MLTGFFIFHHFIKHITRITGSDSYSPGQTYRGGSMEVNNYPENKNMIPSLGFITLRRLLRLAVLPLLALFFSTASFATPYWIFFTTGPGFTPGDPVPASLIAGVSGAGAEIRVVSRYFHAVSAEYTGDPAMLEHISGVREVRPVCTLTRPTLPEITAPILLKPASSDSGGYGVMLEELQALDIPPLHARGLTGKGVRIGVLDSGFDNLSDTGCLKNITILQRRNFIHEGTDVSGDNHGSLVLACIAGQESGAYRAPATGASFFLAVTEYVATETRADEDRWVAAVEWCDSLGADIISSSLVYNLFDTDAESYTKEQMDGRTSLVAQAAEIAVSRGIAVVNAAGNEGSNSWRIIDTPGDAEHVITVGAVGLPNTGEPYIASFSSRGPTADGRIKPDVVAPGVSVSMPVLGKSGAYTTLSGTSFATPLISGLCALLLEAYPNLTPAQLMAVLKATARDLGDTGPDIDYGWGIADGLAALEYLPVGVDEDASENHTSERPSALSLREPFPNPFNPVVSIPFHLSLPSRVTVAVYDITGRKAAVVFDGTASAGDHTVVWNGADYASGVYLVRASAGGRTETRKASLVK